MTSGLFSNRNPTLSFEICGSALAHKLSQEGGSVEIENFRQEDEFDEIQPALASFVLRHEALWLAQSLGNIHLR